jgi:hypothetical protein
VRGKIAKIAKVSTFGLNPIAKNIGHLKILLHIGFIAIFD